MVRRLGADSLISSALCRSNRLGSAIGCLLQSSASFLASTVFPLRRGYLSAKGRLSIAQGLQVARGFLGCLFFACNFNL
jgi:hypothetical protein